MANLVASGHNVLNEIIDYRVAVPLLIVAILGLLFIEMNHHAPITLHSAPVTSPTKKLIKSAASTSVQPLSNLPSFSPVIETEDLSPGETPYTIKTAVPQSSSGNGYSASNSSASSLQNTGKDSITSNNQPSTTDINNLINGTTNEVINVDANVINKVKTSL